MMKVLTAGLSLLFFTCPLSAQEWPLLTPLQSREPLPGTALLETEEDLSRLLVDANDRFLDAHIQLAGANRSRFWKRDFSGTEAYLHSIAPNREHL